MPLDPLDYEFADPAGDEPVVSPLAGTRAQLIQRLQVGLFGLAAMVMVLGLADIIMSTAENNQIATIEELPPVSAKDVPPPTPQRDPLAEAGVVPELPAEPEAGASQPAATSLPTPVGRASTSPVTNAP